MMKRISSGKIGAAFCMAVCLLAATSWTGAAEPKQRSLHLALPTGPMSLNFFSATDIHSRNVLRLFFMPLYIRGPRGGDHIPWLAEGPPIPEEGSGAVIVKLREASWNDGSPVTAHDIAFTIRVIREFQVPGHVERWEHAGEIDVLDAHTIRFAPDRSRTGFFNRTLYGGFIQKAAWEERVSRFREAADPLSALLGYRPETVASNGPFFLASRGDPIFLVLKANPHFFARGRTLEGVEVGPHLESLFLELFSDTASAVEGLLSGRVDFVWADLDHEWISRLASNPHIGLRRTDRTGYDYLGFNLNRPPMGEGVFRRAVSLLIDREALIRGPLQGDGRPVYAVVPSQNTAWSHSRIRERFSGVPPRERLRRARAMLAGAGYTWEDGVLVLPGGKPVEPVGIHTTSGWSRPCRVKVALYLRKLLASLGVQVEIRLQPMETLLADLRRNAFDACLLGWARLSEDPDYLRTFFHSGEARPGGKNYPRFRDPEFDDLADRASRETDPARRRDLVLKMQERIASQAPCIPLYTRERVEAVRLGEWTGWIDRPDGIGNIWSFVNLHPSQ